MGHLGIDRLRLKDFLTRVSARFPVERGIIFGSRARSDELLDSDYDLILISPAFEGMTWRERIGATWELWNLDVDLGRGSWYGEILVNTPWTACSGCLDSLSEQTLYWTGCGGPDQDDHKGHQETGKPVPCEEWRKKHPGPS